MTTTPRSPITPQLVIGVSIMLLGVILTLDVVGLLEFRDFARYWPLALIVGGALRIAYPGDRGGVVGGAVAFFFGCLFLLATLHVVSVRWWRLFWPFVLIFAGGALVLHTLRRKGPDAGDPSEAVNIFALFGGGNRASTANPFRGGDLFAMMGGGRIDLRRAVIASGDRAFLDVFSIMGGFEILVPEAWVVDDRTVPFMGGVANEIRTTPPPGSPTLVLRGFLMMGGITIKN